MPLSLVRFEHYRYEVPGHGDLLWDVRIAKAEVDAGHTLACIELPRDEMANIMRRCEWDPAHAKTVDITVPGIAAPFVWDGQVMYVPIDGLHRIARAHREQARFWMHLLTDAASRRAFLSGDETLMPWTHRVEEAPSR